MNTQFARFLAVGGIAAGVNFASRIVLSNYLPYSAAIVLAYCCGLVTAFALNRRYVFTDATNQVHHQAFWFILVNVVALAQTLVVSLVLAEFILPWLHFVWHRAEVAHAIGVITPVFTSYVGHKRFSFR